MRREMSAAEYVRWAALYRVEAAERKRAEDEAKKK
jgi:hypothetical protein